MIPVSKPQKVLLQFKVIISSTVVLIAFKICCPAVHTLDIEPRLHRPLDTPQVEGSLEVKLPTIWTDEKQSREEAERRERLEERRSEEKESEERRCRCAKR